LVDGILLFLKYNDKIKLYLKLIINISGGGEKCAQGSGGET
jgi:hypothetical protein